MSAKTVRTTIVLPAETAEKLNRFVPKRQRSAFVAEAVEQQLMRISYKQARDRSFGVWKTEDYPHLCTHADVRRHIAELRQATNWRSEPQEEG